MAWTLTPAHQDARNAAAQAVANMQTIALADTGPAASTLRIYTDADPETDERTHLVTITLDKPCGTLVSGQIALVQETAGGDMVLATGVPTWAQWLNGAGVAIASCTVSAEDGDGDLKISTRADGMVFAGGYVTLAEGLIG